MPGTVRFVEQPKRKADFVYIGDIDLFVFDDVLTIHKKLMEKHGIPFSNIIRKGSIDKGHPRLSGLHFCPYESYYPVGDISDINLEKGADECILYEIMRRKGKMVPADFQERPDCGIHLSVNRSPKGYTIGDAKNFKVLDKKMPWGSVNYYGEKYIQQSREDDFLRLLPHLDTSLRTMLLSLEFMINGESRSLHRLSTKFMLDRRLFLPFKDVSADHAFSCLESALKKKDAEAAKMWAHYIPILWPDNPQSYIKLAEYALLAEDVGTAIEGIGHALDIAGGKEMLVGNQKIKKGLEKINHPEVAGILSRIS